MRRREHGSFELCAEGDLRSALEGHLKKAVDAVEREAEAKIMNVDEDAYVQHLVAEYEVQNVEVYRDKFHATHAEELIPAEWYPRFTWNVENGKSYPRPVYTFRLPFTGDVTLLKLRPSRFFMNTIDLFPDEDCLCFKKIDFNDMDRVRRDAESEVNFICQYVDMIRHDVEGFNMGLPNRIRDAVRDRRARIQKRHEQVAALGIPIVRKEDAAETYSVPAPVKRKSPLPPTPPPQGGALAPALAEAVYIQVLDDLKRAGRQMERTPATYRGRDEEGIRDQFLLVLQTTYDAAATGESYNKTGKTDIILRHGASNVFVAECKFWRGEVGLLDTITQLLKYLTWQDQKASVLLFVDNKNLTAVLEQIEAVVRKHPQYVSVQQRGTEADFRAVFHHEGDKGLRVQIAILAFHFP